MAPVLMLKRTVPTFNSIPALLATVSRAESAAASAAAEAEAAVAAAVAAV